MANASAQQEDFNSQTAATTPASAVRRRFVCCRCGACCRWPGIIRLTPLDIQRIAHFLGMAEETFLDTMTELSPERTGLILKDDKSRPCRFLDEGNRCRIQEVKPQQCRDFPEKWNVSQEFQRLCHGAWVEDRDQDA